MQQSGSTDSLVKENSFEAFIPDFGMVPLKYRYNDKGVVNDIIILDADYNFYDAARLNKLISDYLGIWTVAQQHHLKVIKAKYDKL